MSESTAPLAETLDSILVRLAALESKAGVSPPAASAPSSAPAGSSSGGSVKPFVAAYDKYLEDCLVPFQSACDDLGVPVASEAIGAAWKAQRNFLLAASTSKKPSDQSALQPYFAPYMEAQKMVNPGRDEWELHLKTIKECFGLLQWIMIPKPKDYLADMVGACDFWSNKIRVQFKKTEPKQIAWCDALKALLQGLVAYVKEHHLAGVSYDMTPKAGDLSAAPKAAPAPPPAAAKPKPAPGGGGGGLLAELAKKSTGDSAATGLKKVSKDQQTWRKEFSGGAAAPPPAPKPKAAPAKVFGGAAKLGPPVFEFQDRGFKWVVENQTKDTNPNGVLTVEVTDPKHQVYIFKCQNATIDIKGKCKAIVIDTCTKTNVLFDTAISSCEVVNSKRMQLQTRGICPSIAIDKTDGCLTYLSKESASVTSFVTSKSSEMNVSWPDANDDMQEKAIPEQFQHKLDPASGTISSDISDLYSH